MSPRIEDRLAEGTDAAYTAVFLEIVERAEIPTPDLEALALRALRGATDLERTPVLNALHNRRLTLAVPEIRPLLRSENQGIAQLAEATLTALAPQAAREAFVDLTRERRPEHRILGIRALVRGRMQDRIPRISELLQDSDVMVRSTALDALASLGARSEIARIVAVLRDENPQLRNSAIRALLVLDAKEAVPELLKAVGTPAALPDPQLIEILCGLDAVDAAPVIADRLRSKDAEIRAAAARALGDLGAADQAVRVMPLLSDEDETARAAALWVVGRFGLREAADQVVKLLADEDSDVRGAAAWAAGRLRLPGAIPGLTRMIDGSQGIHAVPAAWALGELRAKEVLPRLIDLATEPADVRHSAAEAIGAIGEPLTLFQVLKLLQAENDRIPGALEPALKGIPGTELLAALLRDVDGEDLLKRQRAIRHIGALRLSGGLPALKKILRDPGQVPESLIMTAESLTQLSAKDIIPDLLAWIKDDNFTYREAAIRCVGRLEGRDRVPWLTGLLKDQDSNVQLAALRTLEELGATDLLDRMLPFLTQKDDELDVAAAAWLCRSGRREGVELLLQDDECLPPVNGVRNPAGWKKLAAVKVSGRLHGSRFDIAERVAREAGLRIAWTWDFGEDDISTRLEDNIPHAGPDPKSGTEVLEELVRSTRGDYSFIVDDNVLRILPADRAQQILRNWYESTKPR